MEWFDENGYLQEKALKTWMARNIEVIGLADPVSKQGAEKKYGGVVDDTMLASISYGASTSSDSTETTPATRGKKSKRKG